MELLLELPIYLIIFYLTLLSKRILVTTRFTWGFDEAVALLTNLFASTTLVKK